MPIIIDLFLQQIDCKSNFRNVFDTYERKVRTEVGVRYFVLTLYNFSEATLFSFDLDFFMGAHSQHAQLTVYIKTTLIIFAFRSVEERTPFFFFVHIVSLLTLA
jgi:hypothetical protein